MTKFGYSYWNTWVACNTVMVSGSENPLSNQYQLNTSTAGNGIAKLKRACSPGQTMYGRNYMQHWWKRDPYNGNGATLDTSLALTAP